MVRIVVIGSSSMDLVVTTTIRPNAGETVLGESFKTVPGGKGANQAVAASLLGADVYMVGCVGNDYYGKQILDNFKKQNVNVDFVKQVMDVESGTAHIILAEGDNSIVVVKGANDFITPDYVKTALNIIQKADVVMIQQEIPIETVAYVSEVCEEYTIPLLLNPAPARKISPDIISRATYITPNEHEAAILFPNMSSEEALKQFPNKVFITEGENGVRYFNGEKEIVVPTYPVDAIDTTGAGDTFNAAFAVALAEGKNLEDSLRFANRAASLSVTQFGAQGGMPTRTEVEAAL